MVFFGGISLALALSVYLPSQPVAFAEGAWWLAFKGIAGVCAVGLVPTLIFLGATARGRFVAPLIAGGFALVALALAASVAAELVNHRYGDPVPQWVEVTVERKSVTTTRRGLHHALHVRSAAGGVMSVPVEKPVFQTIEVGKHLKVAVHSGYLGRSWGSAWVRGDA